jgi:hydrogenase maturation protease
MNGPLRVVGVGSPHGDDAIGLEAIRQLMLNLERRANVELHALDSGQRLLDFLDGAGGLILIDALAPASSRPGTIQRLTWPDSRLESLRPGSTHALGVAQALQLASALDQLPTRVVIYAVESFGAEPGAGLSIAASAAIPELLRRVREEVDSWDD